MSEGRMPSFDSWMMHKPASAPKSAEVEQASSQKKPAMVESEFIRNKEHSRNTSCLRISLEDILKQLVLARATDLARAGRYAEAESLLKEHISDLETMPAALDLLARIYAQQRRFQDACAFWTRALELDDTNVAYQAGLSRLQKHCLSKDTSIHA